MELTKKCRICGDRGKCFNYNGHTSCPSCRVFFYRHGSKYGKYQCRKNGKCEIDFVSRKCCIKCRLDKCFSIGMKLKSDYLFEPNVCRNQNKIEKHKETQTEMTLEDILRINLLPIKDCDKLNENLIFSKNQKTLNLTLNDYEHSLVASVQKSIEIAIPEENDLQILGDVEGLLYVSNVCTAYTRLLIRFCKNMDVFKLLCKDEQLKLFKEISFAGMIIRSAFQYDHINDYFILLGDQSGKNAVRVKAPFESCFTVIIDENKRMFSILKNEMENDRNIRNLLTTFLLVQNLSNHESESFRYQYHFYSHLLQRYLEHKYQSQKIAIEKRLKLLHLLKIFINKFRHNFASVLVQFGIQHVNEIVIEIMGLE